MADHVRAVIFDMDGTITVPALDFPRMKAEIGLPPEEGLLESLRRLRPGERAAAEEILLRHETAAARASVLNDGVPATLSALAAMGIRTAILTRNCRSSADIVMEKHGLRFDALVTREDCAPKPRPDGLHIAAARMGVDMSACVMVGDYEFDVEAGRAAGALTVLYAPGGHNFRTVPDFEIRHMRQLVEIIRDLNAP